jgi:ribosomal-protein-alanine N-acetyltransferase
MLLASMICREMNALSDTLFFRPMTADDHIAGLEMTRFDEKRHNVSSCSPNKGDSPPQEAAIDALNIVIMLPSSTTVVGAIGSNRSDADVQTAEIVFTIAEEYRNRGYASGALELLCVVLPQFITLHQLLLQCHHRDMAAIAVGGHAGFAPVVQSDVRQSDTLFAMSRMVPLTLHSPRLIYRVLTMADHQSIYDQFSDADMCRHFSDPPCTWQEAADIITHYGSPSTNKRFARWGIFLATTGEFIGTCGYHFFDATTAQVEIGYDIWRAHWGNGYATESVGSLIAYLWDALPVQTIYALIFPENAASLTVARRHGFVASPMLRELTDEGLCCVALQKQR